MDVLAIRLYQTRGSYIAFVTVLSPTRYVYYNYFKGGPHSSVSNDPGLVGSESSSHFNCLELE